MLSNHMRWTLKNRVAGPWVSPLYDPPECLGYESMARNEKGYLSPVNLSESLVGRAGLYPAFLLCEKG